MCGVIGAVIIKPTEADLKQVVDVFLNMQIRGQHATGVSWVHNDRVNTIKEAVGAKEFWSQLDPEFLVNEDGNLYMIGHVRYSTSDLKYNQPIGEGDLAIVHNGVITQEPPETWEDTFGIPTETSNDSELILGAQREEFTDNHPLGHFKDASMAVTELRANKTVEAYRNHARPLARYSDERMVVYASTADALRRSGFNGFILSMPPYVVTVDASINGNIETGSKQLPEIHKDLQEM